MISAHTAIDSQRTKSLFIDGIFAIFRIAATDRASNGVRIRSRFSIFPDLQRHTVSDVEIGLTATVHIHEATARLGVAAIGVAIRSIDTGCFISCICRILGDIESRTCFQYSIDIIMVSFISRGIQINGTAHPLCLASTTRYIIIECHIIEGDICPLNHDRTGF